MNRQRRNTIAEWLIEVSALVFVFPALDLIIKERRLHPLLLATTALALLFFYAGIYLIGRD